MSDARQILESIIANFSIDSFNRFFREKNRNYKASDVSLDSFNDDDFTEGNALGSITFPGGDDLIVCAFLCGKDLTERTGKKKQYDKAKRILKELQKYSTGIFIFHDPTGSVRFSLIYPESTGTRRQWSSFRRFTYFVGNAESGLTNKTFKQRIGDGDFTSLDKMALPGFLWAKNRI